MPTRDDVQDLVSRRERNQGRGSWLVRKMAGTKGALSHPGLYSFLLHLWRSCFCLHWLPLRINRHNS